MTNYDGWLDQDHDDPECENCGCCRVDTHGKCVECGDAVLTTCARCEESVQALDENDLCEACAEAARIEEFTE